MEKQKPMGRNGEECGEEERDLWLEYKLPDEEIGCDKGSHKQRSIANDANHISHWRKVINSFKRKQEPKKINR